MGFSKLGRLEETETRLPASMVKDVLPWWERCFYWIVGLSAIAKCIYSTYLDSERFMNQMHFGDFVSGWKFIRRKKVDWWFWITQISMYIFQLNLKVAKLFMDHSDFEWKTFYDNVLPSLPWFIGHVLLSQVCFLLKIKERPRKLLLLSFDMLAISRMFGINMLLILFCRAAIMFVISLLGSIWLIWAFAIFLTSTLNSSVLLRLQLKFIGALDYETATVCFIVATAFFDLQLVSVAAEKIKFRKSQLERYVGGLSCFSQRNSITVKKSENAEEDHEQFEKVSNSCQDKKSSKISELVDSEPSLCDFLFFAFYLPVLGDGPILVYSKFHRDIKACFTSSIYTIDVFDILKNLLRITLWIVFLEFQFHFMYYCALGQNPNIVKVMSIWSIYGLAYLCGQFFMVKYLCLYGKNCQFSRFDGIKPPNEPRCISWVYSFSEMWKVFDVGLYNFLTLHIFIPLGGSKKGLPRQLLNLSIVFAFIYFWHGLSFHIFLWSLGNYTTCVIEVLGMKMEKSATGKYMKTFVSPAMQLRIKALLIVPVYWCSGILLCCFCFGEEVFMIIAKRFFIKATWLELLSQVGLITACVHNAIHLHMIYDSKQSVKSHQA